MEKQRSFKHIRAVLLDLDGTMIDSVPDLDRSLNAMLYEMNLPPIETSSVRMFVGKGTENLVRSTLKQHLLPDEAEKALDEALTYFYKYYRQVNGQSSKVYSGVKQGLKIMHENGIHLGCITNKPSVFTEPLLAMNGLYRYFDLIYCSDTFLTKKPDPFAMRMACQKFDCEPKNTVVIGDSLNDAKSARAASCCLFMVPYGYNYGIPVSQQQPDAIIQTIEQAAELII